MSHTLDDASLRELHRDLGLNVSIDCAGHNYNANHASMTLTALYVLRSLVPADAKVQFEAATDAIAHYRSTTLDEVRAAETPSFGADVDAKLAVKRALRPKSKYGIWWAAARPSLAWAAS